MKNSLEYNFKLNDFTQTEHLLKILKMKIQNLILSCRYFSNNNDWIKFLNKVKNF